jgi:tetratricopeptide (TPR) repeat protein
MLQEAQLSDDMWFERQAVTAIAYGLTWGSLPIPDAIGFIRRLIPDDEVRRAWVSLRSSTTGLLLARAGKVDEGVQLIAAADEIDRELGRSAQWSRESWGMAYLDAGLPEQALPHFVALADDSEAAHNLDHASTYAALVAHALTDLERFDEALQYAEKALSWADTDDTATQMVLAGALARALAATGRTAEAARLASQAARWADDTDFAEFKARALLDFAFVSLQVGDREPAFQAIEKAIDGLSERGAMPMLEQASHLRERARRVR